MKPEEKATLSEIFGNLEEIYELSSQNYQKTKTIPEVANFLGLDDLTSSDCSTLEISEKIATQFLDYVKFFLSSFLG